MQAKIRAHVDGESLEASLSDRVFGTYTVRGSAQWSESTGELSIGTHILTSGGARPARELVRIGPPRSSEVALGVETDAERLLVGVIARILVETHSGVVSVTGYVVGQKASSMTAVGRHLVRASKGSKMRSGLLSAEVIDVPARLLSPPAVLDHWTDADDRVCQ